MQYNLARPSDPKTSHCAAEAVTANGTRQRNLDAVLWLVRRFPEATAVELWSVQRVLDRHEISRRLADLKNLGLVVQGTARRCEVKHTSMVTWRAVERQGELF